MNTVSLDLLKSKLAKYGDEMEVLIDDHKARVILRETIEEGKNDSIWYGGTIADIYYKGYNFVVAAIGDVRADIYRILPDGNKELLDEVNDKNNSGEMNGCIESYIHNDEELYNALYYDIGPYRIELQNNNWFEGFYIKPDRTFVDLSWVIEDDSPHEAIKSMLEYIPTLLAEEKERGN